MNCLQQVAYLPASFKVIHKTDVRKIQRTVLAPNFGPNILMTTIVRGMFNINPINSAGKSSSANPNTLWISNK